MAALSSETAIAYGIIEGQNPRGIPKVCFFDDTEASIKKAGASADEVLSAMNQLYSKFKYFEMEKIKKKAALKGNVPGMKKTLQMIDFLREKKGTGESAITDFCVADTIYAQAEVDSSDKVCLWLGANVLMEFSYDEATEIVQKNLSSTESKLVEINEDLDFLKDQITTLEVTVSRVYNYTVMLRKKEDAAQSGK